MQSRAVCANSTRQQLHCRAASCTLLSRSRRPAHTWRCPSIVNNAPRPLRNVGRCGYQPAEAAGGSRQQDVLQQEAVHLQDVPQAPVMLSQQELLDFGATFVKYWFTGVAKGPAAVHQALLSTLHDDVVLKADSVRQDKDMQGLAEVLAELERSHLEYPHSTHQPILYAASPDKQRVYALVEGRYQDAGALPGHPATFRISRVHVVLALELQAGKVGRLWLRRQLTEEDKDELLHDPVHCYPIPFPKDHLQLTSAGAHDVAAAQMEGVIKQWWHTWNRPAAGAAAAATTSSSAPAPSSSSSSHDPATPPPAANPGSTSTRSLRRPRVSVDTTAAGELLAEDFRMLDAYGLYSRMRARGRRHLNKESAMRFMQQLAYQYHIELQVEDVSAAEGSLCCFTQWRALLTPKFGSQGDSSDGGAAVSPAAGRVTDPDSQVATATANLAAGVPPGVAAAAAAAQAAEAFLHQQQPPGVQAGSSTPAGSSSGTASTAAAPEASCSAPAATAGASADHSSNNISSSSSSTVLQPAAAAPHTGYILEGVEVDVFKADLKLHDIWLFRGPLDSEQDLFLLTQQQAAEEQRQLEAAQQERLLQMRREQREQQLQELLTWMTSYQQQWAESIQHVQRVLQHHQRNLQEKGPSALLDGYPLLPPTNPQPPSSGSEVQQAQAPAHQQQDK